MESAQSEPASPRIRWAVRLAAASVLAAACASPRPAPVPAPEPAPPPRAAPATRTLEVTATAYNAAPDQTAGDPREGAWGDRLAPGTKAVAVSPDLLALGLERGDELRIEGLPGTWRVLDRMPDGEPRRIDVFMDDDVARAKRFGERRVRITWEP